MKAPYRHDSIRGEWGHSCRVDFDTKSIDKRDSCVLLADRLAFVGLSREVDGVGNELFFGKVQRHFAADDRLEDFDLDDLAVGSRVLKEYVVLGDNATAAERDAVVRAGSGVAERARDQPVECRDVNFRRRYVHGKRIAENKLLDEHAARLEIAEFAVVRNAATLDVSDVGERSGRAAQRECSNAEDTEAEKNRARSLD